MTTTLTSPMSYQTLSVSPQATDAERMAVVGTDLSRYPAFADPGVYQPIQTTQSRGIVAPLLKAYWNKALGQVTNPVMLTHIVTTRCNYSCDFCSFADSLNATPSELSLAEITQMYQTIGDQLNTIVFSGGETTLNKDLPEIIEAAYRYTPVKSVYIISNAWKPDVLFAITHRIKQTCPDLHLTWSLSIEGPREINNSLRYTKKQGWDAWQNTVDVMWGLKQMRTQFGYTQLDAQLCTVCSPHNEHAMWDWYTMVRDVLQPDKWNLNLLRKSVQMSGHELGDWTARRHSGQMAPFEARYLEITRQVREDVLSKSLKFLYHTGTPWDGAMKSAVDLISQEDNRRVLEGLPPAFGCRAGLDGAYVASNGDVSGCEEFAHNPRAPKPYGNLKDTAGNFQAIWRSAQANRLRPQSGCAPECAGCTLESQRNYPSILVSFNQLLKARHLADQLL